MIIEIYNNFEAAGIQIQDQKIKNGIVFGSHPTGYTTLDIYVNGKLKIWFYINHWQEVLEEYQNIFQK